MQKKPTFSFPKSFLWGAASSAHQVEGGNHNQWSVWELEHAKSSAAQAPYHYEDLPVWDDIKKLATTPANYVSASATNHYKRYEEDFDLLGSLNMNAWRFSVEWSRVEPEEGAWNAEAIDHYKKYVAALKERKIEPVVTLFHFTLPVWFAEKGGFEKRSNVHYFTRFAEKILSELGAHVRYIITVNEPLIYAHESYAAGHWPPQKESKLLMRKVINNLALAHNKTAAVAKQINQRAKVSLAHNGSYTYAGDDAWLSRTSAGIMDHFSGDYFLKKVRKNLDFIGLNYYFSNRVYGYRVHNPNQEVSDLGWDVAPENIEHVIVALYEKYKVPIMVTENGIADMHDDLRQRWITKTLVALQNARDNDAEIIGYLHWSLTDNFEWAHGRWPRFGLAEVDYRNGVRTLRPSAVWFGKVIKKMRKI